MTRAEHRAERAFIVAMERAVAAIIAAMRAESGE